MLLSCINKRQKMAEPISEAHDRLLARLANQHSRVIYHVRKKRCHFIFDYNSGISWTSWSIFIILITLETGMNTLEYSTKVVQNVSLQPNYVSTLPGKTKNNTKAADCLLQCIVFSRLFQTFSESRSMFVSFSVC